MFEAWVVKMDKKTADNLEVAALIKQFNEQRFPRAIHIKERIFAGEKLDDFDLAFLETVFKDAQYILRVSDKHPEHQKLVAKAIQLYTDITEKALENEKKLKKK